MKKEKKNFKDKNRKEKAIDVLGTVCMIIAGIVVIAVIIVILFLLTIHPKPTEMTQEETEWLAERYPEDEERIREGFLDDTQENKLEKLRFGMSYLEEKYPGYQFYINYIDGWAVTIEQCSVIEISSNFEFGMNISKDDDGNYVGADDFYGYFWEDECEIYLTEQFKDKDENVAKVDVHMSTRMGKECDSNMTLEDITSGRIEVNPSINVYISAENMSEDECIVYEEEFQIVLQEINLPGAYTLFFYDLENEEILSEEREEKSTYYCIIHI